MSSNAAPKVVSLREFERPTTQQAATFERLLKECQTLTSNCLLRSLTTMLDKCDEALWGLVNQTQDRETRGLYLAAKERASVNRKHIEEDFRAQFIAQFERGIRRDKKPEAQFSQFDLSSLELNLVADDDLEETLKVNEMATKLRRYCEDELAALDQRIGVLIGDATLQGEANPFSPETICNAFKQTARGVEPSVKVRMVLHKLFDDHVLDEIRGIYKDLNDLLVEHSILPKIRYGRGHGAPADSRAPGADDASAASAPETGPAGEQDMFNMLQGLMTANLRAAAATTGTQIPFPPILGGAVDPALALQGAELLSSLTRIQHGDVSVVAGGNLPLAATLIDPGTINVLRELKATNFATGLSQMDSMTLDIVAMLFDRIFGDEKIPAAMKALIGRLQIPVLKVAILDKTFFSKRAHPARKLLDTLGEIGMGLSADFDQSSPLFAQLNTVVQKLVDEFQDGVEIFDTLREELERVVAEEVRRAEEEAKLVAKRIEHREKLEHAKAVAQQEILQRAKSGAMPRVVLKFLADQWVKVLLIAHAKNGAESDAWKGALETMDQLTWSVNAKSSLEERRRLANLLPGLLKRLDLGMQLVDADKEVRTRFFAKLMRCHTRVMSPPTTTGPIQSAGPAAAARSHAASEPAPSKAVQLPVAPPVYTPAPGAAAQPDDDIEPAAAPPEFAAVTIQNPFGEGAIEVEEISISDLPSGFAGADAEPGRSSGDEYSQLASRLKEGSWVEFRDQDDNRRQARLSYISPLKGTYLFVNKQGKKVGEYSLYQLAREFRTGSASLMEAVPLFERALGGLVGTLRGSEGVH